MQSFLANRAVLSSSRASLPSVQIADDAAAGFRSLFDAPALAEHRRVPQLEATRREEPATRTHLEAPQIKVVQTDGRVTKIIVTCCCCEQIEIDCAY